MASRVAARSRLAGGTSSQRSTRTPEEPKESTSQPSEMTRYALAKSSAVTRRGRWPVTSMPSACSAATTAGDGCWSGSVPAESARKDSPRAKACWSKYAAARTLLAALCGHKKRIVRAGPIAVSHMRSQHRCDRGRQSRGSRILWDACLGAQDHIAQTRDPGFTGRGLRGRNWEKGLSPEFSGPGFQGGSGRPRRVQLYQSPAADPLLTCTKSTIFVDNCQPVPSRHFPYPEP
jgi:hypothetical protein